jgi:hypothetical protein
VLPSWFISVIRYSSGIDGHHNKITVNYNARYEWGKPIVAAQAPDPRHRAGGEIAEQFLQVLLKILSTLALM